MDLVMQQLFKIVFLFVKLMKSTHLISNNVSVNKISISLMEFVQNVKTTKFTIKFYKLVNQIVKLIKFILINFKNVFVNLECI
jgi:hypothetical protein